MRHSELQDLIFAYRDGELGADEAAAAREHLAQCAECRQALEEWDKISAAALAGARIPAPAGFAEGVMSKIAAQSPAPEANGWIIRLADFIRPRRIAFAGAAAALMLALLHSGLNRLDRGAANAQLAGNIAFGQTADGIYSESSQLGTAIEEYFL